MISQNPQKVLYDGRDDDEDDDEDEDDKRRKLAVISQHPDFLKTKSTSPYVPRIPYDTTEGIYFGNSSPQRRLKADQQ